MGYLQINSCFYRWCLGIAVFLDDSVKVLQMPLVSAVEDFGRIEVDLQSIGLEEYAESLNQQDVDLRMLRNAREEDLDAWGITDPHHQTRILSHFSVGKNRNLLQVIRSFSPIFIAMKICFLGGIGISLPLILYFIGGFVVPGLTAREKEFSCRDASLPPFFSGRRLDDLFLHSSLLPGLYDRVLSISLDLTSIAPRPATTTAQ